MRRAIAIAVQRVARDEWDGTHHDAQLVVTPTTSLRFESANPEVATVDASGFVTHVADGSAHIRVYRAGVMRTVAIDFETDPAEGLSDFSVEVAREARVVSPASSANVVSGDRNLVRYTPGTTQFDAVLTITPGDMLPPGGSFVFASSNEAVATVDQSGRVRHVANGSATITVAYATGTQAVPLTFASTSDGTTGDVLASFVTGSLAAVASAAIDSRIAGKTASEALPIWSVQNHAAGIYVRNAGCWGADLDLTPLSPWNSTGGASRAGTLISPRHIIFATHYQIAEGATVRFVAADGAVVNRRMTGKMALPVTVEQYYPDFTIGVLETDVPAGISFARILPAGFTAKMTLRGRNIAAAATDQEEKLLVTEINALGSSDAGTPQMALHFQPRDAQRLAFYESDVPGDSGGPLFLFVDAQIVLHSVMTFAGAGQGTFLPAFKTAVNAAMMTLGGGYQLTEIDLSSYPDYS